MKQTKKFTRNQRMFLEERGVKNFENLRFYREDKHEFVYYDKSKDEVITIKK